MAQVLYKPLGIAFGVLGGLLGGALFKQIWKLIANEADAPQATEGEYSWGGSAPSRRAPGRCIRGGEGRSRPRRREGL
jgi:hypothetical protein